MASMALIWLLSILCCMCTECCVNVIPLLIPDQDNTPVDEKELCEAWSQCKCKTVEIEMSYHVSDH